MTKNVSVSEGYKKTEFGVIPEEWKVGELGTCIKQVKESVLPESAGKKIYVGLEHISSGETKLTNYGRSDSVKSLKFKFTKNNILYGKLRPYLDKAVLTDKEGICSTDIIVIECRDSSIKEFVIYILHSKQFLDYINGTTAGSNLPRTSWQSISKYKVPLPLFSEQQKIASILSKVDEQIEQTEQIIEKTEILKKGLMQKLLTKGIGHTKFKITELGKIPEDWKIVSVKEIGDVKGGKRLPKGHPFTSEKTKYPYLRVVDFKNGTIDKSNLKYISLEDYEIIKQYTISSNDIYISIAGTIGLVGIIPKELDGANLTENAAKIVVIDKNQLDKCYLQLFLTSPIGQYQIESKTMKSAQPKLALLRIKELNILLPPLSEQQKISSILSKVDSQIQDNKNYLTRLHELKKGLMQDLLTGKVRVCV